ncbi:cytochrome c [Ferruginibacter lapsinanis]|uniref:c-type cytochrome n=1 Tax=Ferruginibacter lapsinanis TaxID=563172 RepID=UPI001E342EB8|nr:cytochrome c [Ferruginibacter lapsinanis]UEG50698.1 cytochrome c [Ferruginibacter lapsinanis]
MKRITYLTAVLITAIIVTITSCDSKREPGKIYMPDMAYSRAVESYALLDSTIFTDDVTKAGSKIFYNRVPVLGTVARGEMFPYTLPNDSAGYAQSASVKNPLTTPLVGADSAEAARLFNINCAICHGADGKATGPLATSGKIGGVANLTTDAYIKMADGTMFHSIYYGKNNMGSYASQLSRKQRWELVQYIRTLQPKATTAAVIPAAAASDSTKKAK